MKAFYALPLAAVAVAGNPVKRQASSSISPIATIVSDVPGATTNSPVGTIAIPVPVPSMASMPTSMVVPSGAPTSASVTSVSSVPSGGGGNADYPCPSPYLLTYVNVQETYANSLADVLRYTSNFQNATYMGYINGTGGNTPGATRFLTGPDGPRMEVLDQYIQSELNVRLQIVMNLTGGIIMLPSGASLSNYSTVLQVYTNNSASTDSMNMTTAKLFCNFCASNQAAGAMAVRSSLETTLMNLRTLLMGGSLSSMMPSAPGPATMPSSMPAPTTLPIAVMPNITAA